MDVSGYDRERRGRRESVRPYTRLQDVLSESVPGFARLKRRTRDQIQADAPSLSPRGFGIGDPVDAADIRVGDVAVVNLPTGGRRVIVVEEIGPRDYQHDPSPTVSGPLIASTDPFDQQVIQGRGEVWSHRYAVAYGIRPSGVWDPVSFRDGAPRPGPKNTRSAEGGR